MISTKFKNGFRSANRRVWQWYSDDRKRVKDASRVSRGIYQCGKCKQHVGPDMIDIDHVKKVTPIGGLNSREACLTFIDNLFFCGVEGLIALCKPCHQAKTKEEKSEAKKITHKKTKKRTTGKRKRTKRRRVSRT